ncbi:hypothetical protein [Labrys wisconsinensis]|uniref:Uncharacterized protein n=1 Tax=Labrys wisconsinensis TaxID=425677 RepID=A0ABU0JA64_9HYPH|nr:hypothetical protein [Labrys wisconsinensis]MDQ0471156.1 hypothetical protein [Labrys wisconsinensis]
MASAAAGRAITYYVVQPFVRDEDGELVPEDPIEARSEHGALSLMRRLAAGKAGVLVFSRSGDPALGDFEDAVILGRAGEVPGELD